MRQTTLCVPLDVRPESTERLSALIELLRRREDRPHIGAADNFALLSRAVPTLHFMSLSVFEHQSFDPIFIIEANFDGRPGPFWAQLEAQMGEDLREMLRCCKEPFDRTRNLYCAITAEGSRVPVAPYLEASTQRPSVFHHGNRGLTRDRIIAEAKLFRALREELDKPQNQGAQPYRGAEPEDVRDRLYQKMLPEHPWLGAPGPPRVSGAERFLDISRLFLFATMVVGALAIPGILMAAILQTPIYLAGVALFALVGIYLIARDRAPLPGTEVKTTFSLLGYLLKHAPLVLSVLLLPAAILTVVLTAVALSLVGLYGAITGLTGEMEAFLWPVSRAVILGVLGIVSTTPYLVWWLRRLEMRDHSQDSPHVDDEIATQMARYEDWVSQNHMGSIVLIRPGVLRSIIIRYGHMGLGLLLRVTATNGYLGSMRTVHFAHWAFLNNGSRLLFLSNFDQSWGSYLDDFIEKAHVGLTLAWGCGVGFPPTRFLIFDGASHGRRFKAWALASRAVSRFWYSAYPDLSVDQIERNHRLAEGLRNGPLNRADSRAWMKDL